MSSNKAPFFTAEQQKQVVNAIAAAEKMTSGELKVFVEENCPGDVIGRAMAVFDELEMHQTRLRNGVLFYLAHEDHKFAVIGDKGIHEKVPDNFWETTREHLREHFIKGAFAEGFVQGILEAGEQLKKHFPNSGNKDNELPDEIVFGK